MLAGINGTAEEWAIEGIEWVTFSFDPFGEIPITGSGTFTIDPVVGVQSISLDLRVRGSLAIPRERAA